jgi:hypothetical protein
MDADQGSPSRTPSGQARPPRGKREDADDFDPRHTLASPRVDPSSSDGAPVVTSVVVPPSAGSGAHSSARPSRHGHPSACGQRGRVAVDALTDVSQAVTTPVGFFRDGDHRARSRIDGKRPQGGRALLDRSPRSGNGLRARPRCQSQRARSLASRPAPHKLEGTEDSAGDY